jgi:hypothetical protein
MRFPYDDSSLREFFRDAKDPLEQVFICADLNAKEPRVMFAKLLKLGLVKADMLPQVEEEIKQRALDLTM